MSSTDEKLIVRTALDILSHDTKDLFTRIFTVLSEMPESTYTSMLDDYIRELFEFFSEIHGSIGERKRIESVIDIINAIKAGSEKIPLPSNSRIVLSYDPRKLLYVETSRLVKHALANIIDNALRYSPADSPVRIRIARTVIKEEKGEINVSDNPGGGTVISISLPVFSVADNAHPLSQLAEWFKLPPDVIEKKARIIDAILRMEFPGVREPA